MSSQATLSRFLEFTKSLTDSCVRQPSIIGLVLVGSTAETDRVDEWSDHDFFVITKDGEQESLRTDLSWLPDSQAIAFWFRETEHGLKVVYESGAVLEFAIFDCDELRACSANHHRLAYGDEDVKEALSVAVTNGPSSSQSSDALRDFRLFLSLILIGVGRAKRGEILAAGQHVRTHALGALMKVFACFLPTDSRLDRMDAFRRFEFVYPELGRELANALAKQPEPAAMDLLRIAEDVLAPVWMDFPYKEVRVIKNALAWRD
jgi:hypothetical protein